MSATLLEMARILSMVMVVLLLPVTLLAQPTPRTFTIRLLNGKSGRPMANKNVTLEWVLGDHEKDTVAHIGKDGSATVEVPPGIDSVELQDGPKEGKEPSRLAFLNCGENPRQRLKIEDILKSGHVFVNKCSSNTAVPHAGEIVEWAVPVPWWLGIE